MGMLERRPKNGEIYRHFKGGLYRVETVAVHTETEEELVIYQALYGDFKMYARPLAMFVSEVDRDKYPGTAQRYRFERMEQETAAAQPGTAVEECRTTAAEPGTAAEECRTTAAEPSGEESVHPKLMEFLDADRMEDKYNILVSMRDCVTDAMINTMAVVLDIVIPEGDLSERYEQLKYCVRTKQRYEIERP